MTDDNGYKPDSANPPQKAGTDGQTRFLVVTAAAICAALAILYGIMSTGGKDTGRKLASACPASAAVAARIAPLAVDKLAALAVPKNPKPAVDIPFTAPDGKKLTLKDFRGKTILVNLWATWCVPCRAEMPELDELQASAGSPDFEVVAVNIDTARLERRKKFLDSIGVKHLAFYTDSEAKSFQILKQTGKVVGLPATFLIDRDGCEIGRMAGPAAWASDQAKKLIQTAISK
jgi:thiol-disulfide isomerase/thioredoxin